MRVDQAGIQSEKGFSVDPEEEQHLRIRATAAGP